MILLAAALMFGAAELWYSVVPTYGASDITMGRLWLLVSARSLTFVETVITRHLWSPIWDIGISPILVAPAWSFFGVLGFLFFIFGRAKVSDR
jgi:hypothetical protein